MRIGVLEIEQHTTERPRFFMKKSVAEDLVNRKLAVWAVPGRVVQRCASLTFLPRARHKVV